MRKGWKRTLSLALCLVMMLALMPKASFASVSRSEAVAWAREQANRTGNCDVDGNGLWCTDLATAYINFCWLRANEDYSDPWGCYPYTTADANQYDSYLGGNVN